MVPRLSIGTFKQHLGLPFVFGAGLTNLGVVRRRDPFRGFLRYVRCGPEFIVSGENPFHEAPPAEAAQTCSWTKHFQSRG